MTLAINVPHRNRLADAFAAAASTVGLIFAAVRVSAAVENRRTPARSDLQLLGIPAESLPRV